MHYDEMCGTTDFKGSIPLYLGAYQIEEGDRSRLEDMIKRVDYHAAYQQKRAQ